MEREMLIAKFIQGNLTETEQQRFNTLLETDPDFKDEVAFHLNIMEVTAAEDEEDVRSLLTEFEREAKRKTPDRRQWLVAASIILLMGLGYYFMVMNQPTTRDLFDENFEPYPNVVHPIVRNSEENSSVNEAFEAYQNKDYEKAATMFSLLYEETRESPYLFYSANTLIQLNRGEEAIPALQEHLKTKDILSDKTAWYLAMAYLQIDDVDNTKKMLQTIVEENLYDSEAAEKLLKALK